jgi:hypothetical protein
VFDLFSGAEAEIDLGLIHQLMNPFELSQTKSFLYACRSEKQQMAVGAALAGERGELCKSSLKGPSRKMAKSMSKKQLGEFANTKCKDCR